MLVAQRLVSHGDRPAIEHFLGKPPVGAVGGEVEVGEHDLPGAQQAQLARLRLLHLDDHVGPGEDLLGLGDHFGPVPQIVVVGQPGADPRHRLDQDLVPRPSQLLDPHRQQRNAVLVAFDLFGDSDDHGLAPTRQPEKLRPARQHPIDEGRGAFHHSETATARGHAPDFRPAPQPRTSHEG